MIRLALRVQRAHAELVLAELLELAPAGVEEVGDGDVVEYAVYGAPGELPALPELRAAAGGALVEISTRELADDWHERWRRFHSPVVIPASPAPSEGGVAVPGLHIRPPWHPPCEEHRGLTEITIEPGQAFGTGAHASTRLCLELLLRVAAHEPRRGPALDVGTGSGLLAIAAAKLGFSPLIAIDHERESIAAARANGKANEVRLVLERLDLRTQALPELGGGSAQRGASVVTANLLAPLLTALPGALRGAPDHLIAGGLLSDQARELSGVLASALGLRERERRDSGEWSALWLARA